MSAVIDLMSSDDEVNEMHVADKITEHAKPASPAVPTSDSTKEPQVETMTTFQNETTNLNMVTENTNIAPDQSTPTATEQRNHRRKSQHQMVRTSFDIEFESLSPQKKLATGNKQNLGKNHTALKKKPIKKISILAPKPLTCEQLINIEFEKLLNDPATLKLLREIAAERVRLNQLLTLNFMPGINFTLYTKHEILEFQLNERLKQREIRMKSLSDADLNVN